ncbi:gamma-glutamyl-gamma-aminobutyrate hydrolase family protein [Reichenbachiella versicolor]|uniref:gamma-glutamyl-gamma-aminobutyrate hydrolase family protein n=1 Tax=Reichenbachiella versicolor TaxID=1821036 RepID=UPI000D6E04CC|nr:gamma-glutamyl-gamma-aminobutyrate hydrolase family protein [Reichenbachiella versicolor]
MIKIGISAAFEYPNPERTVFGPKTLSYVENDMARYVARKGVLPVMIPDVEDGILDDILQEMDGFIIQGGADIAPETYGEEPIGRWLGDGVRDQYELQIIDYAVKNNKPIFGICRGFQLMNVYFGGTLYQDTLTQREGSEDHRSSEEYDSKHHPVFFTEDNFLSNIYAGVESPHINSIHHQAIKDLANDLEVWATSPDGLIEAFGVKGQPDGRCFGVQWHPEFSHTLGEKIINPDILIEEFLKHCQK